MKVNSSKMLVILKKTGIFLLAFLLLIGGVPIVAMADGQNDGFSTPISDVTDVNGYDVFDGLEGYVVKTEAYTTPSFEAATEGGGYPSMNVKLVVYLDSSATGEGYRGGSHDIIFYAINYAGERIGMEDDLSILSDLIAKGYAVVTVDYQKNPLSSSPNIEHSLAKLRTYYAVNGNIKTAASTDFTINSAYTYFLPAGYRLARDVWFWNSYYYGSLGTRNSDISAWNTDISLQGSTGKNKTYAYSATFENTFKVVEDGQIVTKTVSHAKSDRTDNVTYPEEMTRKDGTTLRYDLYLDIIYPSQPKKGTPVYMMVASSDTKHGNTCTDERCTFVGMTFSGYTAVTYDHEYTPMVHADAYGYIDHYGSQGYNGVKVAQAALRCVRYYQGDYGYDCSKVAVAGISKASNGAAVLSTIDNATLVSEKAIYSLDNTARATAGKPTFEGDIVDTAGNRTTLNQPFLYYDVKYGPILDNEGNYQYDIYGNLITYDYYGDEGAQYIRSVASTSKDMTYKTNEWATSAVSEAKYECEEGFRTATGETYATNIASYVNSSDNRQTDPKNKGSIGGSEVERISSNVTAAYSAAGDGAQRLCAKQGSLAEGLKEGIHHVPMILSCGASDQYGCYSYWDMLVEHYRTYAQNPFLAVDMPDQGHVYPTSYDAACGYKRHDAFIKFFDHYLKDDCPAEVVYSTPVERDSTEMSLYATFTVKFYDSMDVSTIAGMTLTNSKGEAVDGSWEASEVNTMFTFTPKQLEPDETYTLTVTDGFKTVAGKSIAGNYVREFKTASGAIIRPVADTFVSATKPDVVYGKSSSIEINGSTADEKIGFLTFEAFALTNKTERSLTLPVVGKSAPLYVSMLDGYFADEDTLCYSNMPDLTSAVDLGVAAVNSEGYYEIDIADAEIKGQYVTFVLRGAKADDYSLVYFNDFEAFEAPKNEIGGTPEISALAYTAENAAAARTNWTTADSLNRVYSDYLVALRGNASAIKAVYTPVVVDGEVVPGTESNGYSIWVKSNAGRVKFPNSLSTKKLVTADIGRTFYVSADVFAPADTVVKVGVMSAKSGSGTEDDPTGSSGAFVGGSNAFAIKGAEWNHITFCITLSSDMVTKQAGLITFDKDAGSEEIYVDNLLVLEPKAGTYCESFEKVNGTNKALLKDAATDNASFASHTATQVVYRTGGEKYTGQTITNTNGNYFFAAKSGCTSGRFKFLNIFSNSRNLTKDDIGTVYEISFSAKADSPSSLQYGFMNSTGASYGTAFCTSSVVDLDTNWVNVTFNVEITQTMVDNNAADLAFQLGGSAEQIAGIDLNDNTTWIKFYIDNITVRRASSASTSSRENKYQPSAAVMTKGAASSIALIPVSETYVDSSAPETVGGTVDKIYLNGSGLTGLVTYDVSTVKEMGNLSVVLPVTGGDGVTVKAYAVEYNVDPATVTYNKISALDLGDEVGKATISGGTAVVEADVSEFVSGMTGDYLTMVLVAAGGSVPYTQDFDSFAAGLSEKSSVLAPTGYTSDALGIYGADLIARRGYDGGLSTAFTPAVNDGVLDTTVKNLGISVYMKPTANTIRGKFYNLIKHDGPLTDADVGKTVHVSLRVLAESDVTINVGLMNASGGSYASAFYPGTNSTFALKAKEWTTVEKDFVIESGMLTDQVGLVTVYNNKVGLYIDSATSYVLSAGSGAQMNVSANSDICAKLIHSHIYDQQVTTEDYFVAEATEVRPAQYVYSCVCGEAGTETFFKCSGTSHLFTKQVVDDKYIAAPARCDHGTLYYYTCELCGAASTTVTFEVGERLPHTPGAAATETEPQVCTVCGTVLMPPMNQSLRYKIDDGEWQYDLADITEIVSAIGTDTGIIEILKDYAIPASLTIAGNVTIRSFSDAEVQSIYTLTRKTNFAAPFFAVSNGGEITVENITIDGKSTEISIVKKGGVFYLPEGAKATIKAGTTIENCYLKSSTADNNGAVAFVYGGQLIMEDGIIRNCKARAGGAIYLEGTSATVNSSFIMKDGLITCCLIDQKASLGAAVAIRKYAVMEMSGGMIVDNSSLRYDNGGVATSVLDNATNDGGIGIREVNSEIIISGDAVIRGNTAPLLTSNATMGKIVTSDIGFYGNSTQCNTLRVTIKSDFTGSVGIFFPFTDKAAFAKTDAPDGTVFPTVIDNYNGKVAVANGGKLSWVDPVAELTVDKFDGVADSLEKFTDPDYKFGRYLSVQAAFADATEGSTVRLLADDSVTDNIAISKSITFEGNGKTLTRASAFANSIFTINGTDIDVSIKNLTIDGKTLAVSCTTGASGITILGSSDVVLDNVTLTGCKLKQDSNNFGGGIRIGDTSTLVMNNVSISGSNSRGGGAIYLAGSAVVTFNSGEIFDNVSVSGGAASITGSSKFIMNGGLIRDNKNDGNSGWGMGGAINVHDSGVFEMNAGMIIHNAGRRNRFDGRPDPFVVNDAAVAINDSATAKVYISGTAVIRDNTGYDHTLHTAGVYDDVNAPVQANISSYRKSSNAVTFRSGFVGSVGMYTHIVTTTEPFAKADGYTNGTVIPSLYCDASGSPYVAIVKNDTELWWTPAVAEIDQNGLITRYATMDAAIAAANEGTAIKLLADAEVTLANVGDNIKVIENGHKFTVNSTSFVDYTETKADAASSFKVGDTEFPIVADTKTYTAKVVGVEGYTISLSGDIAINFFVKTADPTGLYAAVSDPIGNEKTVNLSDITPENGMYKVTFNVAAKQMTDGVTIEIYDGDDQLLYTLTRSVHDYATYLLAHTEDKVEYANAADSVKAMLVYGGYAQTYFGYSTADLANAGLDDNVGEPWTESISTKVSVKRENDSEKQIGISVYGVNLELASKTTLRYFFQLEQGKQIDDYSFTVANENVDASYEDGYYVVEIKDIDACDLDTEYSVKVTCNEKSYTATFSVLRYVSLVQAKAAASPSDPVFTSDFAALCRAIYFYNVAANAYFGR